MTRIDDDASDTTAVLRAVEIDDRRWAAIATVAAECVGNAWQQTEEFAQASSQRQQLANLSREH